LKLTDRPTIRKLSNETAAQLLSYDRTRVTAGIVHLGIGAFCRAHVLEYVDTLLVRDPSWGVIGASLKRPDTRNALAPQDFLYTLLVRSPGKTSARVIGSLVDVLDASTQRDKLIEVMADPKIRIVSLTITEKGYCHDPATGELDPGHPDIRHDLAHPESPSTAPGLIVRALELRRNADIPPFTVLCCDNLPSNGETAARVIQGYAKLYNASLADYIENFVAFPSTMVDRIVPATTEEGRQLAHSATGLEDAWPVMTEPFTQWVIEDHFTAGRPRFEKAGAEMVVDVRPFELMKLRMLNGSHSTLAYLGYLSGYEYVSDAIANPHFHALIHGLMTDEVIPTLPMDVGSLATYRDALIVRFANSALKHRTWQIAMDGSQKLPQRLLGTIRDRLQHGLDVSRAALGVAAWMRYVTGIDESGKEIDVKDPLAASFLQTAALAGGEPSKLVEGLLAAKEIFGSDLPQHDGFRSVLHGHVKSLYDVGALRTVQRLVEAKR
jgi:fructuronate reductase